MFLLDESDVEFGAARTCQLSSEAHSLTVCLS